MKDLLRVIERAAVAVGVLLSFFAVIEILRAYTILRDTHAWLGYGFLAVLAVLLGYVAWQVRALFTFRTALSPPALPEDGTLSAKQARAYRDHLGEIEVRFRANTLLESETTALDALQAAVQTLPDPVGDGENLREAVRILENERIAPLLKILDREAEAVVSDNVGIVSLGTALSPYRSVDLYIVMARNARMIRRIVQIYRTRPTTRETVRVFYDVIRVVAAVNLINAMDNVWTGLGRHVPFLGRYGEAMSEGLFSGLLTSVAGHAAIDRCRSYKPWSREEAVREYRGKLSRWSRDVWSILKRHSVDRMTRRDGGRVPADEFEGDPGDDPGARSPGTGNGNPAWWNPFGRRMPGDVENEGEQQA